MEQDKSIATMRLNPNQPSEKVTRRGLFPPHGKYFNELIQNCYKTFLEIDATTDDGMMVVAEHCGVQHNWRSYLEERIHIDRAEKYCNLLLLVQTLSKEDHVLISFVEGLH